MPSKAQNFETGKTDIQSFDESLIPNQIKKEKE
jgi:hypothetical protein